MIFSVLAILWGVLLRHPCAFLFIPYPKTPLQQLSGFKSKNSEYNAKHSIQYRKFILQYNKADHLPHTHTAQECLVLGSSKPEGLPSAIKEKLSYESKYVLVPILGNHKIKMGQSLQCLLRKKS